jgi:hypothetical protein
MRLGCRGCPAAPPEGRAQQVLDDEVAGERPEQREIVEGNGISQLDAEHARRLHRLESLETVEDRVVLLDEVEKGHPMASVIMMV